MMLRCLWQEGGQDYGIRPLNGDDACTQGVNPAQRKFRGCSVCKLRMEELCPKDHYLVLGRGLGRVRKSR